MNLHNIKAVKMQIANDLVDLFRQTTIDIVMSVELLPALGVSLPVTLIVIDILSTLRRQEV